MKRFLAVMFMALLPIAMGCGGEDSGTTDDSRPGVTDTPRTDPAMPGTRTTPSTSTDQTGDSSSAVNEESADEMPEN